MFCQFFTPAASVKWSTIFPAKNPPMMAPNPFVISINKPWALFLTDGFASLSTNNEPDILKKSNAIPYTIMERISNDRPDPGLPTPNNPKRNTQASILISITCLIPNRRRKNGNGKDEECFWNLWREIRILLCFTAKLSAYAGLPQSQKGKDCQTCLLSARRHPAAWQIWKT